MTNQVFTAGADKFTGGTALGSADKATIDAGADFNTNDTVAGAGTGGTSTIEFNDANNFTVSLAGYANITGITRLTFVNAQNYDVTVTDAFVVNNRDTTNALTFTASSTGSITINASTVTATNSVKVQGASANDMVTGGAGNDTISGGGGADTLSGGARNDLIVGNAGNDVLDGGAGGADTISFASAAAGATVDMGAGTASDGDGGTDNISNFELLFGSGFADLLRDGTNNETISGGAGADTISGAAGIDFVNYLIAPAAVNANLATGTASDGHGNTDTLVDIEGVIGSAFADTLTGNSSDNTFNARGGNDTIDGGTGTDYVSYVNAAAAVNVNTSTGSAIDGDGGTDTFTNIEGVIGSGFADTIIGGANNDTITGLAGADSISGGAGFDFAGYSDAPAAINANLATGTVSDGHGSTDTLVDIEGVIGSGFADTLTGNGDSNTFNARGGNDTIDGAGGNDFIAYVGAAAAANINLSTGSATDGEGGTDTFTNIEGAVGSDFADTITGSGAALEFFDGRAGNDTIDGGAGVDWVRYPNATAAINVNLTSGSATDGQAGTDTLTTIENVRGTGFNDTSVGNTGDHFLFGGAGTDNVSGGIGNDTILGDPGNDTIDAGAGDDLVFGDDNADLIVGGAGNDTIVAGNSGDAGNDTVFGDNGDDLIFGSSNNDQLQGDAGNDTILNGSGNDTIQGNANNDVLWGGGDADRFIFGAAGGSDTIADFQSGADKIDLTAFGFGNFSAFSAAVTFANYDNGIAIAFSGGAQITIIGSPNLAIISSNLCAPDLLQRRTTWSPCDS